MSNQPLITYYVNPVNRRSPEGEGQGYIDADGLAPIIVAMKGHPGTGKSTLAWSLAESFHYSFISLEDIRDTLQLQQFLSDTVSGFIDDLSYEAVCRVASSYVQSGSNVVIDCPLSQRSHCDMLLQVSNDLGAKLIIVECKPQDLHEWQRRFVRHFKTNEFDTPSIEDLQKLLEGDGDYGVGDIRTLVVNSTLYFDIFSTCIAVLVLSESPNVHHLDLHRWMTDGHKRLVEDPSDEQFEKEKEQRKNEERDMHHIGHVHEFSIFEGPEDDGEEISCKGCLNPITGTAYHCTGCKFFLHKACAEMPHEVQISPHSEELPFFKPVAEEYTFPKTYSCSPNNSFSFHCWSCLFMTHLRCGFLPSVLNHQCHEHPLLFQIHCIQMQVRYNHEFQCRACGKTGKHVSYSCPKCNVHVHVSCAFLPATSKHRYHRHSLCLTPCVQEEDPDDEFYCDICETKGNPKNWAYYCAECKYASHVECATSPN